MYMFVFGYIAGASYSYKEIYNLDSKTFGLVFGATGSALFFGALLSTKLLEVLNMKQLSISGSAYHNIWFNNKFYKFKYRYDWI